MLHSDYCSVMRSSRLYLMLLFVSQNLLLTHMFSCPPGMKKIYRSEKCIECTVGTFQSTENTKTSCSICNNCDEDSGSMTERNCESRADTKCKCRPGFTPKTQAEDVCKCAEGSGLVSKGTDTECQVCKHGFFTDKPDTTCQKWTDCGTWGIRVSGTSATDNVCNNDTEVQVSTVPCAKVLHNTHSTVPTARVPTPTPTPTFTHTFTHSRDTRKPTSSHISLVLIFYVLSLVLLVPLSAVSCKLVIIPFVKNHLIKMDRADAVYGRPVEECGDRNRSSLVKSSQGLL